MGAVGGVLGLSALVLTGLLAYVTLYWCWTEAWGNNLGHEVVGVILLIFLAGVFFYVLVLLVVATIAVALD